MNWTRIPCDIPNETDRRKIIAILADSGLEVRTVRVKIANRYKRFVEYREAEENKN